MILSVPAPPVSSTLPAAQQPDLEPIGQQEVPFPPSLMDASPDDSLTSKTLPGAAMTEVATTTLSSKGQVVIPEAIRRRLGLEAGAQFVVIAEGDVVILKRLGPPPRAEFDALVTRARRVAQQTGLTREDIASAVRKVRRTR
jgi:AbrB family looped-hinge helix DNA binding protein